MINAGILVLSLCVMLIIPMQERTLKRKLPKQQLSRLYPQLRLRKATLRLAHK